MTPLSQLSVRRKVQVVVLASALIALVVGLGAMIAYDLIAYRRGWISDLEAQVALLGRTTAPALTFDDERMARENLGLLRFQPKVRAAAIYDRRGVRFASYEAAASAPKALPAAAPDGVRTLEGDLVVARPILDSGHVVGTVYLRASDELYERVTKYSELALVVAILALVAASLASAWLQTIITRPILAVADVARRVVERRDYVHRAEKLSDDEVGGLVDAFNAMLDEIERRTAELQGRTNELEASNREKDREVEERRLAQQEVMRLNSQLEQRVQERTSQLEQSNRDLLQASLTSESSSRAKSDFLSSMSHELRTPLNAIIGFGQLLAAEPSLGDMTDRKKRFVHHIVGAGEHLLSLITDILNLSQIEAGKLGLSLESIELDDVLDECRILTEGLASKRSVQVVFPERTRMRVEADRTRLKQVLLNLLTNAVKYNRDGGAVIVTCSAVGSEAVRVSVRDTGQGLDPAQLQALFQPFNRLGREGTDIEGTGIGLVLTKRLIEMMGGSIGVQSTPGDGSLFRIDLKPGQALSPVVPTPGAAVEDDRTATDAGTAATILCVDDNAMNLALLSEALGSRPGWRVLQAVDGRQGFELARRHRPDVILMDNNMPLMTGPEALAALRADPSTAAIPVIAVSANAMPNAVTEGLARGYFRYLVKPVMLAELLAAVDAALDRASANEQ